MNQEISGGLDTTRCPEIIKILSLGKRSGRLLLNNGAETGSIYFRDGEIIHAQCGTLKGTKAIYELAVWTTGEYQFFVDEIADVVTVDISMEDILTETANRIRQMDRVTSLIPSSSATYSLDPDIKDREINLKAIQWKVLANINGKHTINDIAQIIGLGVSDTMKVFYTLIKSGLLRDADISETETTHASIELPQTSFMKALKEDLTRAIGPIAPFVIMDTAQDMGLDLLADDVDQRSALIETLSSRIPDEEMSLKFLDTMTDWLNAEE